MKHHTVCEGIVVHVNSLYILFLCFYAMFLCVQSKHCLFYLNVFVFLYSAITVVFPFKLAWLVTKVNFRIKSS